MSAGGAGWRGRASRLSGCLLLGIALLASALGLIAPSAPAAERPAQPGSAPDLAARAWILIDPRSGETLAAKDPNAPLPIASATKLMTAYLALAELPLDRSLRAAPYNPLPAESILGLVAGQRISVRDLLVALLLPSANDAAVTLAEEVSGGVPAFVEEMNRAAARLGLTQTSYGNPIGLDAPDNFSSAADLAELATVLNRDRRFRRIVSEPQATVRVDGEERTLTSRNDLLLADRSVDGVKTGQTQGAGFVLVGSAERKGIPLVSVVLGAESEAARDSETAALLDYGYSLYEPRIVVDGDQEVGSVPVLHEDEPLALLAAEDVELTLREDQEIEVEVTGPEEVEGPVAAGEPVSRGVVLVEGRTVASVPLLAARLVEEPGPFAGLDLPLVEILIGGGSIVIGMALILGMRGRRTTEPASPRPRSAAERAESQRRRSRRRGKEG